MALHGLLPAQYQGPVVPQPAAPQQPQQPAALQFNHMSQQSTQPGQPHTPVLAHQYPPQFVQPNPYQVLAN